MACKYSILFDKLTLDAFKQFMQPFPVIVCKYSSNIIYDIKSIVYDDAEGLKYYQNTIFDNNLPLTDPSWAEITDSAFLRKYQDATCTNLKIQKQIDFAKGDTTTCTNYNLYDTIIYNYQRDIAFRASMLQIAHRLYSDMTQGKRLAGITAMGTLTSGSDGSVSTAYDVSLSKSPIYQDLVSSIFGKELYALLQQMPESFVVLANPGDYYIK